MQCKPCKHVVNNNGRYQTQNQENKSLERKIINEAN